MVTSPTSRTRTGTPFCEPTITSPMSRVIANQADAADVVELPALRVKSAAGVGVVDAERCSTVRNGDVIAVKSRGIEQHLILHHRAAEAGIVRDSRHLLVLPLDDPVFVGLQFLRRCGPGFRSRSDRPGPMGLKAAPAWGDARGKVTSLSR